MGKHSTGNGDAKRLAQVICELPSPVQYQLLEATTEHLVAEGKSDQLQFLFDGQGAEVAQQAAMVRGSNRPYPLRGTRRRRIAFGWYGGKFSHLNWLLPLLPPAHHYCEPFGGSAAVLLNREPSPVETYNDLDGEVARFFRVLRDETEELLKAIALTPFSREEFALAIAPPSQDLSDVELARRFFVRARQVRTGLAQTASIGRWANCKDTTRGGMAGAVSRWLGSINGLPEVAARLLRVQIENRPAVEVVRLYDGKDTLFYCDPPYPHEVRGDSKSYRYEMSAEDHRELADVLRSAKAKVAISGYGCTLMEELYAGWRRIEAPEKKCHSIKKPRTEVLWVNC